MTDDRATLWEALMPVFDEVVKVGLVDGQAKHGLLGWRRGRPFSVDTEAAARHLTQHKAGRDADPDSKLSPLAHAIFRLAIVRDREIEGVGDDDR